MPSNILSKQDTYYFLKSILIDLRTHYKKYNKEAIDKIITSVEFRIKCES